MARVFRFRLAVVQQVREHARTRQRRRVAQALREVNLVKQRMATMANRLQETTRATRATGQTKIIDVHSLRTIQFHRGWLERRMEESATELEERARALEVERSELAEATKHLKVIEKLRERQWGRHKLEEQKEERADLDEAAVHGYLRKRASRRASAEQRS